MRKRLFLLPAVGTILVASLATADCPEFVGEWRDGAALGIAISGNYAYVGGGESGLRVLDASDPASPWQVQILNTPGTAHGVAVSGQYVYVADRNGGFRVINVAEPASPTEEGFLSASAFNYGWPWDVAVSGNFAYVTDEINGLYVVDVSNPESPSVVGFWPKVGNYSYGVDVAGNYAFVGSCSGGLRVIDVSDPALPQEIGFLPTSDCANDVSVSGDFAHVAAKDAGLRVIDISDPENPFEVGFNDGLNATFVSVSGRFAYVSHHAYPEYAMRVLDVADPITPIEVGSYTLSFDDSPFRSAVYEGYVYQCTFPTGIMVLRDCAVVFTDSFESGDTTAWSAAVP